MDEIDNTSLERGASNDITRLRWRLKVLENTIARLMIENVRLRNGRAAGCETVACDETSAPANAAMQGRDAKATLWAVDQHCRSLLKHGEPSEETRRHLEEIREMLRERPGLLDD